jgi:redox-sensitive bicupin YhaK (pirin superfamily)
MLWAEEMSKVCCKDNNGKDTNITLIAGKLDDMDALAPAPDSWAANPKNDVAIWIIEMEPGATWNLPAAASTVKRALYFFAGSALQAAGESIPPYHAFEVEPDQKIQLEAGPEAVRLLLLQGRPIGEQVVQYGPFVMNSEQEIRQAFADFRRDEFGGWPWNRRDPVHPRSTGRFAKYADGTEEIIDD